MKADAIYVEFSSNLEVIYFKRSNKVIHCFLSSYNGETDVKKIYKKIEDVSKLIDDIILKTKDSGKEDMKKQFDESIPEYKVFKRKEKIGNIFTK